jgi:RNA polymerase sigma factor (sigma-70 family)
MNPAQSILFDLWLPWARRFGSRWALVKGLRGLDKVFAQGMAEQGLWDAVKRFEPGRKVHFLTYAELRIRGALADWSRSISPGRGRSKFAKDVRISRLGEEDKKIQDPDGAGRFDRIDDGDFVSHVLASVPCGRYRDFFRMAYLEEKTLAEIGARWGCSESRVSHIKREALAMAREIV